MSLPLNNRNNKTDGKGHDSRRKPRALSAKDIEHLRVLGRAVLRYRVRLVAAFVSSIAVAAFSVGSITVFKPILDIIFGTMDQAPPLTASVREDWNGLEGALGFPGFDSSDITIEQDGSTIHYRALVPPAFRDAPEASQNWFKQVYGPEKERWIRISNGESEFDVEAEIQDRLRSILTPLYTYLNGLAMENRYRALALVAVLLVILTFAKGIATYIQDYLTSWIGRRVVTDLRERLYDHIMSMNLAFFQRRKVGSLMSYLTVDIELFGNSTMAVFGRMIQEPFIILIQISYLLFLNMPLTLFYAAVIPILGLIMIAFGKRIRKARRKSQDAISMMSGILQETMSGVRVVRAFQMEDIQREKFRRENEAIFRSFMRLSRVKALSSPLIESLASLGVACILMIAGWFVFHRGMEASSFMVYLIILGTLYQPIKRLNKAYESVQQGLAGADRIFDILERRIKPVQKLNAIRKQTVEKGIEFKSIRHRYGKGPWVVENISFEVPKGFVTALVGPSGSENQH